MSCLGNQVDRASYSRNKGLTHSLSGRDARRPSKFAYSVPSKNRRLRGCTGRAFAGKACLNAFDLRAEACTAFSSPARSHSPCTAVWSATRNSGNGSVPAATGWPAKSSRPPPQFLDHARRQIIHNARQAFVRAPLTNHQGHHGLAAIFSFVDEVNFHIERNAVHPVFARRMKLKCVSV